MKPSLQNRPLEGILVLEFAQFLSGPLCGLRLADLGATVVKIERPGTGDTGRSLYLAKPSTSENNVLFQAINRNKQSFAADLKSDQDRATLMKLIAKADVIIQNFRPGVMERLGFGYEALKAVNERLVYASISGFGEDGPWVKLPGQDLLAQARSGLMYLNGFKDSPPMPVGVSIADILAGLNLTQGILAALVGRGRTGKGAKVDTSLLESLLDFQFELLTHYFNEGENPPVRGRSNIANAFLGAPYGVYRTKDSYMAIAMAKLSLLADLLNVPKLAAYDDPDRCFDERDTVVQILAAALEKETTDHWLSILQPADVWCAEIMDWPTLLETEGVKRLEMFQELAGVGLRTTRPAIRIDDALLSSERPAPEVGEHTQSIMDAYGLA